MKQENDASHKGTVDFFKQVQPILETKCLECHRGGKAKGGLHLDSRAGALKGGKSDGAAIVPGSARPLTFSGQRGVTVAPGGSGRSSTFRTDASPYSRNCAAFTRPAP